MGRLLYTLADLFENRCQLAFSDEIHLTDQYEGCHLRGMADGQIALQAIEAEIAVDGLHDDAVVDIGRDDLHLPRLAHRLPFNDRLAGKDGVNERFVFIVGRESHPVADGGQVVAALRRKAQVADELSLILLLRRLESVAVFVFRADAPDLKASESLLVAVRFQLVGISEVVDGHGRSFCPLYQFVRGGEKFPRERVFP